MFKDEEPIKYQSVNPQKILCKKWKIRYKHTGEISSILLADEELQKITANAVNEIAEKALSLNSNGRVSIDNNLVESVLEIADLISEDASPELRRGINKVKRVIRRRNIFRHLGITINE